MGLAAGPLCVMSMDDFGFFSEASEAPYSSGSESRSSSHHDLNQQHNYYPQEAQYHMRVPSASMQTHDFHRQRYLPQQQQAPQPQQQHPHRLAPSESDSDGTGAAGQSPATPAKRGSNLACLKCRAIKVKCWKSNPNDPRCSRCNRLDLFCEFRKHHRGKKLEKVIADENRNVVLTPDMLRRARRQMLRCSSYPLGIDLAALAVSDNSQDAAYLALPSSSSSSKPPFSPMFGNNSYGASGLASAASLSPVGMASSVYDNVVQMNACSWTDACYLYSLFMTQLNPIAALLEPSLHTVQFTREQSPILFSTILAITSRFFRPALHPQCQAAAAAILKFASSRQLCSVDHIQALIVSAIWATPGDTSRSDTIAAAVAYAYELGLPFSFQAGIAVTSATKPYTPSLPVHLLHNTHQTTTLRVQQRTWIQLCLLESNQQCDSRRTSKRPDLIAANDFPNVRSWYKLNHSTMSAYDTRLAYQLDLALSQRQFDRLSASMRSVTESDVSRNIDSLLAQEAQCFSTWFRTYGDEYVARYALDRYSNVEAGFFLLLYRFGRAVQLYTVATSCLTFGSSTQLQDRWFNTATELAFKVLDSFNSKVLDQDATSSSMLRFSPQYMASGCLAAARWLLPSDSVMKERALERVNEMVRLLSQPQFYPDGNRVPTSNEMIGQLDQALRSLMGDAGMIVSSASGTSPKRPRAQQQEKGLAREEWEGGRKQRRRTSTSLLRLDNRGVSDASDRVERSPHAADKWKPSSRSSSGYVSGDDTGLTLGESHWPPSLLSVSSTTTSAPGSWTPTSEDALSNMAIASASISPPPSAPSTYFINPPYTSAMFAPTIPGLTQPSAALQSFPLARENTTTQQSYDTDAAQGRYGGGLGGAQQGFDLDASLTIGLGESYQAGASGDGGLPTYDQRQQ
ncbi:uncharacterized protein SPSC_01261 [Sporisorium scitamineum]|uniref:Zn(2)-C6 fungal-type domain-containing protein n=2 Tax=Sporisorium scitamineum TaxID=49012 RepID=A0A127Z903_9BASI|nr:uncharacterized protein SPSC_01261 [Sporisorium scitamineum]